MDVYPIGLVNLHQRRCVVVGGGAVAERKVGGLLDAGARVVVISPEVTQRVRDWAAAGRVQHLARAYQPGDLAGAFLGIAATDDVRVNAAVWQEGEARRVLVNVVDDPERSHFIAPAVHRQGDLTLTVSTGGRCPALAALIRDQLRAAFGRGYGELVELLGAARPRLLAEIPPPLRREFVRAALDLGVLQRLQDGDQGGAEAILEAIHTRANGNGQTP